MKGDGQVITKLAVINHQLGGFVLSLDTPEDTLSAADVATGAPCNAWLSNQSLSNRQNELAAHVCASDRRANKEESQLGTRLHLLPLACLDAFLTSSSNTQTPLEMHNYGVGIPGAEVGECVSFLAGNPMLRSQSHSLAVGFCSLLGKQTTDWGGS